MNDDDAPLSSGNNSSDPEPGSKKYAARVRTAAELVALKDEIIKRIDVRAVYNQYLPKDKIVGEPKSDGWARHNAHCPLHNDQGKPNLSVNLRTGGFRCWGCGEAGSIFDFWCKVNQLNPKDDFSKALVTLADIAGVNIADNRQLPFVPEGGQLPERLYQPKEKGVNKARLNDTSKPPLQSRLLQKYTELLQADQYKYLTYTRGLIDETIQEFEIGFDPSKKYKDKDDVWRHGKYLIPIRAEDGSLRNVRYYAENSKPDFKIINKKGYGEPYRLFPLFKFVQKKWDHVIYCEGEWDAILLNQKLKEGGFHNWIAMTATAGCNSFEPEFMEYFQDIHFYFLFDNDAAGRTWALNHANKYFMEPLSTGKILSLKILDLPVPGSKDMKDVTDFFVKMDGTIQDIMELIEKTPPMVFGGINHSELVQPFEEVDDFSKVVKDRQYIDMRVRVPITIGGQTNKIYHATRTMKITSCPLKEKCNCEIGSMQTVPYGNTVFIESCMATKRVVNAALREVACPSRQECGIEEIEKVVMEEHYASQRIERLTATENEQGRLVNSQELVSIPIYVLQPEGGKTIGPQDYIATGYIRSHPNTRAVCMFVEELEPIDQDWRQFKLTEETIGHLKVIQDYPKMGMLLKDIQDSVTYIYEAQDILLTILLTYTSPLFFFFNGTPMRGWINSCIIGDSGTGKTKTYQRISDWLNLGDLFSTLSGSRTGLLYAIRQRGTEWYVQIGRYVMASGKILAIDETQEMDGEDIKKMGKAMDEGWLEVSRVASGGYMTTTRALFLMNPPNGQKISDFPYGCLALTKCFHPMFIRRLDIAVFSTGKNDPAFYNQHHKKEEQRETNVNSRVFKSLVHWAWTRESDQIIWSDEATMKCLEEAIRLSKIFGQADDVPLVNPQDFRNNLARLATSYAILSGSFSDDYNSVIIKHEHVVKISLFIEMLYSSSACNLKQHSKNSGMKKVLLDDEFPAINDTFQAVIQKAAESRNAYWRDNQHFLQLLTIIEDQQRIRMRDIAQQLGVSIKWVQRHLSIISMHNLIDFSNGVYRATRKFNIFMQKWKEVIKDKEGNVVWDGEKIERLLSEVMKKRGRSALIQPPDEIEREEDDHFGGDGSGDLF